MSGRTNDIYYGGKRLSEMRPDNVTSGRRLFYYMAGNFKKRISNYLELARANGLELVGDMPPNTNSKANWRCPLGHEWQTTYSNIRSGTNCPSCSLTNKRVYFETDYHRMANEKGYEFLGPTPHAFDVKTNWRCNKGHTWSVSFVGLRGCPYCASNGTKLPIDYHNLATDLGFQWLGPISNTVGRKTNWRCNRGHEIYTTYNSLFENRGCYLCMRNRKKTEEDYSQLGKDVGMEYIGPFPPHTFQKTKWRCAGGHDVVTTYATIRAHGAVCAICSGNAKRTNKDFLDVAEQRGFMWLGPITRGGITTSWKCSKGHIWKAAYHNIKNGSNCPECRYESMRGEKSRTWRGGTFVYPDTLDTKLKASIRRRDGRVCLICGKTKKENHRTLDVHHIIPARFSPSELCNAKENLITLCRSHHQKCENSLDVSMAGLRILLSFKYQYQYIDNPTYYLLNP